jgi:methylmalonyl-CoA mutase C-terminal domain/subunit
MKSLKKKRILLAKPGLDGHDRGILVVARELKDAGFEVIYLGRHQTPEKIVNAAIQEDVDVIGISNLSDAHMRLCGRMLKLLAEKGAGEIPVILGGFIPEEDVPLLKKMGIAEVFGVGTKLEQIVNFIKQKPE